MTDTVAIEQRPDEYFTGRRPVAIPPERLRRLSERNGYRATAYILAEWALIIGSVCVGWHFFNPSLYVLLIFWMGGRQHSLGILMHEGAHYLLISDKGLNDWISDIFLAWPIFITTDSYRANHWQHHRFTNTPQDPDCMRTLVLWPKEDWEFPTSWLHLGRLVLKDLTGFGFLDLLKSFKVLNSAEFKTAQGAPTSLRKAARVLFYLVVIGAAVVFGIWKPLVLFWIVPYMTTFNVFLRIRSIAEHFATENENPLNITRTTLLAWWERPFFGNNINYHIEHHLYPSVPFYRLPELHSLLMQQSAYRKNAHVTRSYLGVLRECVGQKIRKTTCLQTHATAKQ